MKKVLVLGSEGLLGSSLRKELGQNHIFHSRKDANLISDEQTKNYLTHCVKNHGVDTVINCAALVGGVLVNSQNNHRFFLENYHINNNVITNLINLTVKNYVNISSTCVFPDKNVNYPLTSDQIDNGPPHESNYGYSYAKRLSTYNTSTIKKTLGWNWITVIPSNIYGVNDNFNLENSHVIPGLIHKAFISSMENTDLIVWGDGTPKRQFIYVDDLSKNILWALNNWTSEDSFMAVNPNEISIKELVMIIASSFKIPQNKIYFDNQKPNGQAKKPATTNIPSDYKFIDIHKGLKETINWFIQNYKKIRK